MALFHKTLAVACLLVGLTGTGLAQEEAAKAASPLPVVEFRMSSFEGQVVVLDFWASWCVPCRQSLPWLNAMQEKYGAQGLQVVMVNLDQKPTAAAKMAAGIDSGIRQFLDPKGALAATFELDGMPSSYLYDRSGKLISNHVGFLKADGAEREKEIAAALSKEQP